MNGVEEGARYRGPDGRVVREMFASIAPRYDLLNHILSLSIDRYWRRRTVSLMASMTASTGSAPDDLCLDLCSGTGDLALEIARKLGTLTVASDFCHPMLIWSGRKIQRLGLGGRVRLAEADALQLPFADAGFRFVTVAFGVRNIEGLEAGLAEMLRVLRPGGALVILEFSRPVLPVFREAFDFYFGSILPRVGSWISGTEGPYQYLPRSVRRFPSQRDFARMIESIGFRDVQYRNLTGGIAAIHWAVKPLSS